MKRGVWHPIVISLAVTFLAHTTAQSFEIGGDIGRIWEQGKKDVKTGLEDGGQALGRFGKGVADAVDPLMPWGDPHCRENPDNQRCKDSSGNRSTTPPAPPRRVVNVRGPLSCSAGGDERYRAGTTMCFGSSKQEMYCTGVSDNSGDPTNGYWEQTGGRCR